MAVGSGGVAVGSDGVNGAVRAGAAFGVLARAARGFCVAAVPVFSRGAAVGFERGVARAGAGETASAFEGIVTSGSTTEGVAFGDVLRGVETFAGALFAAGVREDTG